MCLISLLSLLSFRFFKLVFNNKFTDFNTLFRLDIFSSISFFNFKKIHLLIIFVSIKIISSHCIFLKFNSLIFSLYIVFEVLYFTL